MALRVIRARARQLGRVREVGSNGQFTSDFAAVYRHYSRLQRATAS